MRHTQVGPCLPCTTTSSGRPVDLLPSLAISRPALLRYVAAPRRRLFSAASAAARHALAQDPSSAFALAEVLTAPLRFMSVGVPPQHQPSISFRTAPPPLATPLALALRGKLASALSAMSTPSGPTASPSVADLSTLFPPPQMGKPTSYVKSPHFSLLAPPSPPRRWRDSKRGRRPAPTAHSQSTRAWCPPPPLLPSSMPLSPVLPPYPTSCYAPGALYSPNLKAAFVRLPYPSLSRE